MSRKLTLIIEDGDFKNTFIREHDDLNELSGVLEALLDAIKSSGFILGARATLTVNDND